MKTKILWCVLLTAQVTYAQNFSEKLSKELAFEKKSTDNTLIVANMNGTVKVTGYDGDKIIVEVTKSISAKTETRLEKGKKEVSLGIIDRADTLILYVQAGCNQFGRKSEGKNHSGSNYHEWGYQWNCDQNNCRPEYDYKMDFVIKVPATVHLIASTINDGDITVENVKGKVKAENINGSIRLTNLERETDATTINGDVDVEYAQNPRKDCRFYSLNGDINALFQPGLTANMSFESFNGNFYTNVKKLESLPVTVVEAKHGDGIKYKVTGNRYQIGTGGAFLDFETFNGNVYLKEKTN
jgi:hypothetical protein